MKLFELMDVMTLRQDVKIQDNRVLFVGEKQKIPEELEHREIKEIYFGMYGVMNITLEENV